MKPSRFACLLLSVLALSCTQDGGPVLVDAQWNLTCPPGGEIDCVTPAETCLGVAGQREIVGEHRQIACTGRPIVAICEAIQRSDGSRLIFLEANVNNEFALELRGATVDTGDGSMEATACNVTIIEDQVPYDVGDCGQDPPSMAQPCQLSNIETLGNEVVFDLECDALLSSTTGAGFDVGAVGGGPTTIRFANCTGF